MLKLTKFAVVECVSRVSLNLQHIPLYDSLQSEYFILKEKTKKKEHTRIRIK